MGVLKVRTTPLHPRLLLRCSCYCGRCLHCQHCLPFGEPCGLKAFAFWLQASAAELGPFAYEGGMAGVRSQKVRGVAPMGFALLPAVVEGGQAMALGVQ